MTSSSYPFELHQQLTGCANSGYKTKNLKLQARSVDRENHSAQIEVTITEVSKANRLSQKSFSITLTSEQIKSFVEALTVKQP